MKGGLTEVADLFPQRDNLPGDSVLKEYVRAAMRIQKNGMSIGKRPFGAFLMDPDVPALSDRS
jgi:hypothetical protein